MDWYDTNGYFGRSFPWKEAIPLAISMKKDEQLAAILQREYHFKDDEETSRVYPQWIKIACEHDYVEVLRTLIEQRPEIVHQGLYKLF